MSECMIWKGATNTHGYGWKTINMKQVGLHRVAWEWANGPIPKGMSVLHKCDNPPCVNPDHLFIGTQRDNIDDMVRKGRSLIGTKNPHAKLTESDVLAIRVDNRPYSAIAKDYGISISNAWHIKNRKSWRHL